MTTKLQKALEWAEAVANRSEIEQSLSELSFEEHDYLGILAREVRALKKELDHSLNAERGLVDMVNDTAEELAEAKERINKLELEIAEDRDIASRVSPSKTEAENAELRERVKELEAERIELKGRTILQTTSDYRKLQKEAIGKISSLEAESIALAETIRRKNAALGLALDAFERNHAIDWNEVKEALSLQPQPARAQAILEVVEKARAWKPTVRGASREHLIPEALALVDALSRLDAEQP